MANTKDSQDSFNNPYGGQDGEYPPLGEEILAQIKQMAEQAEGDMKEQLQELLREKLGTSQKPVGPVEPVLTSQFFILLILLLLVTSLFVFFGYKLYKNLKDKERKRDEKKKLRQQKKKK